MTSSCAEGWLYRQRMARRTDPDRIQEAKRAGIRARMASTWGVTEARADELLDEWEAEAARIGPERSDPTTGLRLRSGCVLAYVPAEQPGASRTARMRSSWGTVRV
jgi:hypothetical protein